MVDFIDEMPLGDDDFQNMITSGAPYVDKTSFLAHIINRRGKAWYFSRPRRFGKTLTVSTLEHLFSGRRDLFKGLAIEELLDEKKFAPRPVLRLDMSLIRTSSGLQGFQESLTNYTREKAELMGVEVPSDQPGESALRRLIETLGRKSPNGIAVLIDEYDAPLAKLLNKPHLHEDLREIMRDYYMQLKGLNEVISFLFATGISRNSNLGLFSVVNHITDITIDSEYGAMLGFTHEELEKYFDPQLEESALSLKISKAELLEKMKSYYNGFSFDGQTLVYNPYSTLMFFSKRDKFFDNYWFDTGTPKILADFMRGNHLTVEQFSGAPVNRSFAKTPAALDKAGPMSFLYQSGYLSLRAAPYDTELFILDYPNVEVRSSMSRLVVENIIDDEAQIEQFLLQTRKAFRDLDADGVVKEYNGLLARLPYEDYKANASGVAKNNAAIADPGEWLFRSLLFALIWGAGLRPIGELHGSLGRSDIVVPHEGRHWVIELKISKNTIANDKTKAKEALNQILSQDCAKGFDNPILLALAVNEPKREVTTWVKRVGLNGDDVWTFPNASKPATAPPKAPKSPVPSKKRSGPRK